MAAVQAAEGLDRRRTSYPAGSLLAADFEAFLAGSRDLSVLFTPEPHTSLQSWSWTRDFLLLNLLRDVSSEIRVLDPREPGTDTAWAVDRTGRLPAAA